VRRSEVAARLASDYPPLAAFAGSRDVCPRSRARPSRRLGVTRAASHKLAPRQAALPLAIFCARPTRRGPGLLARCS